MKNPNLHCDEILIPDITIINAREDVKLAVLNIMNEDIFKNKGKDIHTLAKFPIYGIPVEGVGDWKEFEELRQKEYTKYAKNFDRETSLGILRSYVRPDQVAAWVNCKEVQAKSNIEGMHVWPSDQTDDGVTINFYWNAPINATQLKYLDAFLEGSDEDQLAGLKKKVFEPKHTYTLLLKRDPEKEIRLVVNWDFDTATVFVAPTPPPPIPPKLKEVEVVTTYNYDLKSGECRSFGIVARPGMAPGVLEGSPGNPKWIRLITHPAQGGVFYGFQTFHFPKPVTKITVGHGGITVDRIPRAPATGWGAGVYLFIPPDTPEGGFANWITPNRGFLGKEGGLWGLRWDGDSGVKTAAAGEEVISLPRATAEITVAVAVSDAWYKGSQDYLIATFENVYVKAEIKEMVLKPV